MGVEFQLHRGSVHLARGFNQIQKAGDSLADDKYDRATSHLDKALKEFGEASNNFTNAENDAYAKAGTQIDGGHDQLAKSVKDYTDGNYDSAQKHLNKALENYDKALDMVG
jgi:tetratricopeptide (TPR) repeat protein